MLTQNNGWSDPLINFSIFIMDYSNGEENNNTTGN